MHLKSSALAALAALITCSTLASAATDGRKTYIVQLRDEPAASYKGGVSGLSATQVPPGAKFLYGSSGVQAYVRYLSQQQGSVAATIGHAPVIANYHVVFNGFAARLSPDEVLALKSNGRVADVFEDQARRPDTISTPRFLGLSTPGGLWSQTVGGAAVKGEGMVIGVVDGGVWPENPAFADKVDAKGVPTFSSGGSLVFGAAPATFSGSCQSGEGFNPAIHCNNKLIGAKFFNAGFLASGLPKNWSEFYSPRDSVGGALAHGGHGDHTASTAAGNSLVPAVFGGIPFGPASGMAPRARVSTYKVCWTYDDPTVTDGTGSVNSCFNSDSVAAIDAAVKDGVNAINFSISGATNTVNDPVEQAFYRASLAGVFVAASAGNSGPAAAVAHISPWLTTVAASTHDRSFVADLHLSGMGKFTGASLNIKPLPVTALVRAEDVSLAGVDPAVARLCFSDPASLDPAKVKGKVVICTRGTNARVDKSLAVLNATGVGMVLADNGGGVVAEVHSVPTVHVNAADGATILGYAAANAGTAATDMTAYFATKKPAPIMAGFSSRGPNAADANVLKPDLTAPGVDVIASVTPGLTPAQRDAVVAGTLVPPPAYDTYSGTSMSSPHVAGLSLLLKQAHPTWSPAAIKSALMTTGYSTLDDGLTGAQSGLLPWAQGAGHVKPTAAVDPGLVYNAGAADYIAYQCKVNKGAVLASDCATYGTLDETYNLNLPSITVGAVVSSVIVKRSVTNVGTAAATYAASATVPGFTATVTPASLALAPGETKSFTVTLNGTTAVESVWNFGTLAWTDGTHVVTVPVQARLGKLISAPDALVASTVSGSRLFTVKTGFAGKLGGVKGGLKDVVLQSPVSLVPAPLSATQLLTACTVGTDTANVKVNHVAIPASTLVTRFALRDVDTGNPGKDDFDMLIMSADGSTVVYSGTDGSNEAVQLVSPRAGAYKVCVVSYGTTSGAATASFRLSSWVVTPADVGGGFKALLPPSVYNGGTSTVGLTWSGLTSGHRYLGAVDFLDPSGAVQAATVLRVEPGGTPVLSLPDNDPGKVASFQLR